MKFNQVTALAAATIIIPLTGTVAHLSASSKAALAEPSQALAQNSDTLPEGKRRGKGRRGRYLEQLDLTDDQKAQIKEIRQEARADKQSRRETMRAARDKMRSLYASDASANELRTQHQELRRLRNSFSEQRFETKLKIREVLTLEQRQKLVELKSQRWGGRRRSKQNIQSFHF